MPSKFVVGLRGLGLAVILLLGTAEAADSQPPSLMGARRDVVLQRLGEPRSSIVAGNREVLLFERDRVVLRNNVVVEVDALPVEVSRPAPTPAADAPETAATEDASGNAGSTEQNVARGGTATSTAAPATAPSPSNSPLEIRAVRPAGTSGPRSAPKTDVSSASPPAPSAATPAPGASSPVSGVVVAPAPVSSAVTSAVSPVTPLGQTTPQATTPTPSNAPATPAAAGEKATDAAVAETVEPKADREETTAPETKMEKAAPAKAAAVRRPAPIVEMEDPPLFTARSYVIAFVIVVGGIGYLVWRSRQRKLELAATAVSRTPFATPVTATAGARFTADLLAKLEWKRFEQLVAAYYGKTGVVAVRTNTGPSSPVHIKISWKGESRPFAFVHCIAHPTGLVDAKPIQELVASLMADDIRRGYVVTTGKFSVPARDFAEEKAITLLPGDIFLEKLNALPDGARNELMQEIATGDYTTPSCPTCDAKMVRAPDDPTLWRCPAHPEVAIPAWK